MAAVRAASRERLAQQEAEESRSKESLVKNAASYLEKFYQVGAGPPSMPCTMSLEPGLEPARVADFFLS